MKFYDPAKTFLELVSNYQGDLDDALDKFEHEWDTQKDARTHKDALGVEEDRIYLDFLLGRLGLRELTLIHKNKTAASVPNK